jgi:putative mRNA 3-end processing factor
LLRKAFGRSREVKGNLQRKEILSNPSVIITTSGMLTGGPVNTYIKSLYNREDCAIILTGYQVEGTPGRHLMDKGKFLIGGTELETKMQIHHMDFSAHAGKDELFNFIEKVNPKKIIPVHGDSIGNFVSELKAKGFDAILAKNGDTIKV